MEIITAPVLAEGEKRVVFIVQDESIFYTNDSILLSWLLIDETFIKPKSTGQSQHCSAFTCECHGFMTAIINGQLKKSYKIITPGKNSDGYWTNDDLVQQLEDIDGLVFTCILIVKSFTCLIILKIIMHAGLMLCGRTT